MVLHMHAHVAHVTCVAYERNCMDLCSPVLRVLRVLPVPLEQARHLDYGAAKRSQKNGGK